MDNTIAALADWLDESYIDYINDMIDQGSDMDEVWDFINRILTKKEKGQILDRLSERYPEIEENIDKDVRYLNSYPPTIEKDMEYRDYIDKLPEAEQEWIKQFYHERYANGAYGIKEENRILKTSEMLSEARRIVNARSRDDAFSVSSNTGRLEYMDSANPDDDIDDSMLSWRELFMVRGYETALNKIYEETKYELDNTIIDVDVVLTRFYIKMEALRKLNNKDIETRREIRKRKSK